jgi:hypothetical protein
VLVSTFDAPAGRREIVLSGLPCEGRPRIEALLVDDTRALAPIPVEPLEQDANTADGGSPRTLRVVVDLPADAVCLLRCLPER